jgi:hypothetical protein
MSLDNFFKSLSKEGPAGEIVKTAFNSLFFSLIFVGLFLALSNKLYLLSSTIGFYILFAVLSYSIIMPSVRHVRSYSKFPSMSGMMIGMTMGMVSGFLPGFIIGATNGMFYGSIVGMAIGIFLGIWNGKCCGVMGVMEGIMAGFMGGLMGAMTAVMTLNDHIMLLGVILFLISAVILFGLNYLIYKESKSFKAQGSSLITSTIWSIILSLVTSAIMLFGPRSFLFQ